MLVLLHLQRKHGFPFGYELLVGRAAYAVDPAAAGQRPIVDMDLAPRDVDGQVRFAGDVAILRPVDPAQGNRRLFFDWGNRGNKRALIHFNDAAGSNDPATSAHAGNCFLMRRGYTVVWAGWQGDLLAGEGRMRLDVPVAEQDGRPVRGPVRVEYVGRAGVTTLPLSAWTAARSHPTISLDTRDATLTRRRYADSPREAIAPEQWCFARLEGGVGLDNQGAEQALVPSRDHIHVNGGFEPGWIYELIYTAEAPLVLGLAHAAVRDLVSYLRYDPLPDNPLQGSIDCAYGWGRSQGGRVIRDFIYAGFNADEVGRRVFDGLLPHASGAGRVCATRFAQMTHPGSQQYEDHFNPSDEFPFAYAVTTDHLTGRNDGILKRPDTDPLVIHTQTASEYWQRRGSLVHTDTQGNDLAQPDNVRIYFWSGIQHAGDPRLKTAGRGAGQNDVNVVSSPGFYRAMLDAMDRWATDGTAPPASRIPTRAGGTLVTAEEWRRQFPSIAGTELPAGPNRFRLLDYGPGAVNGVHARQPPKVVDGSEYTVLVPAVDSDGNDVAGVRAPMVTAPLGTYTGWNMRRRGHGHGAMHRLTGSTIPFAETIEERVLTRDSRAAIPERYPGSADYVAAIGAAARQLVAAGFMIPQDVEPTEATAVEWARAAHDFHLPAAPPGTKTFDPEPPRPATKR